MKFQKRAGICVFIWGKVFCPLIRMYLDGEMGTASLREMSILGSDFSVGGTFAFSRIEAVCRCSMFRKPSDVPLWVPITYAVA